MREAHVFHGFTTVLMMIVLVGLTAAVACGRIDFSTYVSSVVVVLIVPFFELGLALKEEIKGKIR